MIRKRLTGVPAATGRRRYAGWTGPFRSSAGFSIIEFVFAVSVVGYVLVGFSATANTATMHFRHFRNLSQAVAIADAITEQLLIMDASDDSLREGTHTRYYNRTGARARRLGDRFYTGMWVVSNYEDVPGIRRIDISVSWMEKYHERQVNWTTYRN